MPLLSFRKCLPASDILDVSSATFSVPLASRLLKWNPDGSDCLQRNNSLGSSVCLSRWSFLDSVGVSWYELASVELVRASPCRLRCSEVDGRRGCTLRWVSRDKDVPNKVRILYFHRHHQRDCVAPVGIQGTDGAKCVKMLGVWLQDDLGARKQCDCILKIFNQRQYLPNLLRRRDLPQLQLRSFFRES